MAQNRHGLTLRTPDPADADGIAELLRSCGLAAGREQIVSRLAALKAQPGVVVIADEWGPPTGIVVVHWAARLTEDVQTGQVSLLLVDPDRRRSGVARMLLKVAAQAARVAGCGEILIHATPHQADVRAFALATGFTPAGERLVRPLRKQN